jgi:hypothetical protein
MTLDKASKIAEITGAVAVIVGLFFVGLEVRDNTKAQRFNNTQSLVRDYNDSLRSFVESDMSCVLMKGYEDFDSLGPLERIEFSSQTLQFLRVFEQMYYAHLDQDLDAEVFGGFTGQLRETLRVQGLREYFEMRKHWFGSRFGGYVDGLIAESDPISGYYGFSDCEPK